MCSEEYQTLYKQYWATNPDLATIDFGGTSAVELVQGDWWDKHQEAKNDASDTSASGVNSEAEMDENSAAVNRGICCLGIVIFTHFLCLHSYLIDFLAI